MRLIESEIRRGIIHPERVVRDASVRYFAQSFSDEPAVMPLAIQAVAVNGWEQAFSDVSVLCQLAQTQDTLLWFIDNLNRQGYPQTPADLALCLRLSSVIAEADVSLLMTHEERILGLEGLGSESREVIAERLALMTLDSPWQELERLCEENAGKHAKDFPLPRAGRLCEAIARAEANADEALAVLSRKQAGHPAAWLECFAACIAGEMRLEAAVPVLIGPVRADCSDVMNEECGKALVKIGTDATVAELTRNWAATSAAYRLRASSFLGHIHSDLAEAQALKLAQEEKTPGVRRNVILAALRNFSTDGIEPARRIVKQADHELRDQLVAVATLSGAEFPELDQWKHQGLRASLGSSPSASALSKPAGQPPLVHQKKPGRNDPCPCGSNKKYKKCCMGKDA